MPVSHQVQKGAKNLAKLPPKIIHHASDATRFVMDHVKTGGTKIMDHTSNFVAKHVKTGAHRLKNGAHHLKNVFARPLTDVDNYMAPIYPKSRNEEEFIEQAILLNFVFSNMSPKELKIMIAAFEKVHITEGEVIIQQGDNGDYFYVLVTGQVQFDVDGSTVGTAHSGDAFGELSLLYTCPRAATARATQNCELFRVDQKTFRYILQSQTKLADTTRRELLQSVPFLNDLDERDLNKMIRTMVPRPFKAGEYLVKKGDEGDAFYVIQDGQVSVTDIEIGGQPYEDMVLGGGDFFGERALVTKEPRAANCIGASAGMVLRVDSATFVKVMGDLSRLVSKATDKRTLERMDSCFFLTFNNFF